MSSLQSDHPTRPVLADQSDNSAAATAPKTLPARYRQQVLDALAAAEAEAAAGANAVAQASVQRRPSVWRWSRVHRNVVIVAATCALIAIVSRPSFQSRMKKSLVKRIQPMMTEIVREAVAPQKAPPPATAVATTLPAMQPLAAVQTAAATRSQAIALAGQAPQLRDLPYPFHNYLTVISDCDNQTFEDRQKIYAIVHDRYQLNMGDQVFISQSRPEPGAPIDLEWRDGKISPLDWQKFYDFLVWHRRGWIDSVHGWGAWFWISSDQSCELTSTGEPVSQTLKFEPTLSMHPSNQHYLLLQFKTSSPGLAWDLVQSGQALNVTPIVDLPHSMGSRSEWTAAYVMLPRATHCEVTLRVKGQGTLSVRHAALTNGGRARLQAEADFLREYRTRFATYIEHGKNRHEFTVGSMPTLYPETRRPFMGDDSIGAPTTYFLDILDRMGMIFLGPYSRTAGQYDAIKANELLQPFVFADGRARHGVERFAVQPRPKDNPHGTMGLLNSASEPWMGFNIEKLLAKSIRRGTGGAVYTHWGTYNPKDTGLSADSQEQLARLSDAHYNFTLERKPHERVWVAPVSEFNYFARAMQAVKANSTYDPAANTIHIRSWTDPLSQQVIPTTGSRAHGLGNLTLYVRDSATAKLLIDNVEYTSLVRNPADETGAESVTIVDDSLPTVVFGELDLFQRFGDCVTSHAECYFRSRGGYLSSHALELKATDQVATAEWTLPKLSTASHTHLRFAYRKSNEAAKVGLQLQLADGRTLIASEADFEGHGWQLPHHRDNNWHDVVVPFAALTQAEAAEQPPIGAVSSIQLVLHGEKGDQSYFDNIQFIQQPVLPLPSDDRYLVAGRVTPPTDGVSVVLLHEARELKTTTAHGGLFFFTEGVPRGAQVSLYALPADGAKRFAITGRLHEIFKDEVEMTIDLADIRDANVDKGLKRIDKAVSEIHPQGGFRFKPKSMYTNSGIAGAVKQEWCNTLQISNLGFLDKDRRFANVDGNRRVVVLGHCIPFGHSMPRALHANIVAEGVLRQRLGSDVEVASLAATNVNFGRFWPYWSTFGKEMKPDVVAATVMCGTEIMECDPDLLAKFNEYDPQHLPQHLFRSKADGSLEHVQPDPEYFNHLGKNEELAKLRAEEKKIGYYYMDGVEWLQMLHRVDLPPVANQALAHFENVARHYRDELAQQNCRFMIILTAEIPLLNFRSETWKDMRGNEHRRSLAAERLDAIAKRLGIGFCDLTKYIEGHYPQTQMTGWKYDTHPSPYGMQWFGEGLAQYLIETRFLADLPYNDLERREELARNSPKFETKKK